MTARFIKAMEFAIKAHDGQQRDYTNEPYILHPLTVADLLRDLGMSEDVVIAGLLHDVLEDTDYDMNDIAERFGRDVAFMVRNVSRASTHEDGNRATRKEIDRIWYASGNPESQTIKLADICHNTSTVHIMAPKGFAKMYLEEQLQLVNSLNAGDARARKLALNNIERGLEFLNQDKKQEA